MAKRNEVYKCAECGNIVEVIVPTDKDVCGFKQLKENTTDAATEKHVPVVEKIEGGYRVTVGEVEHPMTEAHYIQFIELITDNNDAQIPHSERQAGGRVQDRRQERLCP